MPATRGRWRRHQPAATRRAHGLRSFARQYLDRAASKGRAESPRRTLVDHAEHRRVVMALAIVPVPVLNDNYVWLVHDPASGETAAVDPSVGPPVLEAAEARGWRLTQVLNTHW